MTHDLLGGHEDQSGIEDEKAPSGSHDFGEDTVRLFVSNIAYSCTSSELEAAFSRFGTVTQVCTFELHSSALDLIFHEAHIPIDRKTKEPKGLAFISYSSPNHARAAYEAMNRSTFQGRILHILPAVDRRVLEESHNGKEVSLKEKRLQAAKKDAGKDFNWAMLYMNVGCFSSNLKIRTDCSQLNL